MNPGRTGQFGGLPAASALSSYSSTRCSQRDRDVERGSAPTWVDLASGSRHEPRGEAESMGLISRQAGEGVRG
jgi:hypothetical protein